MLVLIHFRNPGSTIPTPSLVLLQTYLKTRSKRQLKGSRMAAIPEPQQSKSPISPKRSDIPILLKDSRIPRAPNSRD